MCDDERWDLLGDCWANDTQYAKSPWRSRCADFPPGYKHIREHTQNEYSNVQVNVNDMIAVLAVQIAAAAIIGTVFTPAVIYDLFWPERWEAPIIHRLWKWSAVTSSIVQFTAAIAVTVVMVTGHVSIQANDAEERAGARSLWEGSTYNYRDPLIIATVTFSWIGLVFTVWR